MRIVISSKTVGLLYTLAAASYHKAEPGSEKEAEIMKAMTELTPWYIKVLEKTE